GCLCGGHLCSRTSHCFEFGFALFADPVIRIRVRGNGGAYARTVGRGTYMSTTTGSLRMAGRSLSALSLRVLAIPRYGVPAPAWPAGWLPETEPAACLAAAFRVATGTSARRPPRRNPVGGRRRRTGAGNRRAAAERRPGPCGDHARRAPFRISAPRRRFLSCLFRAAAAACRGSRPGPGFGLLRPSLAPGRIRGRPILATSPRVRL